MRETRLHTDERRLYTKLGAAFAAHETIHHSAKEYARGEVTTNSVEGYSRSSNAVRAACISIAPKRLHRYLAEYDFRFNNRVKLGFSDAERATLAVKNASDKRLTYRECT